MKSQFISSRDIAQRLEMIRQPEFDTPARRKALKRLVKQWNRQHSRPIQR